MRNLSEENNENHQGPECELLDDGFQSFLMAVPKGVIGFEESAGTVPALSIAPDCLRSTDETTVP